MKVDPEGRIVIDASAVKRCEKGRFYFDEACRLPPDFPHTLAPRDAARKAGIKLTEVDITGDGVLLCDGVFKCEIEEI
jgi:hypothetical protein